MSTLTYIAGYTGRVSLNWLYAASQVCVLILATLYWSFGAPLRGKGLPARNTAEHFVRFGADSLPIVALISFLIGAIMAMQSATQLARFGALSYIASLVGVAGVRELAPLMTAIIVTGRSGSAITAEIGTMKVSEEIDALKVMGINPVKFLVVPKFLGMLLALPCLTVMSMVVMIAGGYLLAVGYLGLSGSGYIDQSFLSIGTADFLTGLTKSVFFAVTICWVGVVRGFQVSGGAAGVGKMTTSSVVSSIFLIILIDLVFTFLFFFEP
ncbi:MAG: ABC transporter permease [Pseudomonadota bacterium]|nr:MAG: ABC transporter permease [Pseudomonadota bacterium]